MEISNEMRAAIYHAYHTAQVAGKPYIGYSEFTEEQQNKTLIGNIKYLDKEGAHVAHADVHGNPWNEITFYNYGECQLLLYNLKYITDVDLFEVARLTGWFHSNEKEYEYYNNSFGDRVVTVKGMVGKYTTFAIGQGGLTSGQADYLRSKSYHVPYMGIDLFENGIAKEIKHTNDE
jgi:hypothetical protein